MTIKAWLEGERFDLQDLADILSAGDTRVLLDDSEDRYYLTAPEIDHPPDGVSFYESAQQINLYINGIGRIAKSGLRPVRLSGRYETPEGEHHVIAAPAAEGRLHVRVVGGVTGLEGEVQQEPSPYPEYIALAKSNELVDRVLRIMGADVRNLDWYALWKVLELVAKGAESTGRSIVTRGWCTVEERKALQKSANSYEASGDTARHAVDNGRWKPGDPKLSIEEGQALVSRLVNLWLQSLA
ncbi:hypothetical protein D2E42_24010 [Mycobacteroides abscessus]|uniref:hypothetical protein n=1 Tax=Mycobacteroides abscessus TaxID=36809 RepID=UPI000D3E418A|nr:hypothetical protein [Mycobacteroides abscessus]PVB47830.1 hypothetical protein DDK10_24005 [Mycobacteroides abscessus]RIR66535.1 hypothetical protein D2E42_24010 [Mycobacteroides abscessus]